MRGGVGDPMKMAGGIGEALICTATGLIVAIPAYVLHRYFRSKVAGYCVEMEKQATQLLDELTVNQPATRSRTPRATESSAS
jgi:biopolymer transport protein ExbB